MDMHAAGIRPPSDWPIARRTDQRPCRLIPVQIDWHPSPNFGPRKGDGQPRWIVLHYTAMTDCARARDWLCTPAAQVSAHYILSETGQITQMVADTARAWHAGAGGWQGCADVNSASLGVELANDGAQPFGDPQMRALEWLLADLQTRHGLTAAGVIAHSDCAPGRKIDPGPRFDWRRLARAGLALWPDDDATAPVDVPTFDRLLTRIGYPDAPFETRLAAFRLRFGGQTGPLTKKDMGRAENIVFQMAKISPPEA